MQSIYFDFLFNLVNINIGKNKVPSCTLSRLTCDTFLRDALLNKQLKIEIWAQGSKGLWKLVKSVRLIILSFFYHYIISRSLIKMK